MKFQHKAVLMIKKQFLNDIIISQILAYHPKY